MDYSRSDHLQKLLKQNFRTQTKVFGSSSEYRSVRHNPSGNLKIFIEKVLPAWKGGHTGQTEKDAEDCLDMFKVADSVHHLIQAYDVGIRDVYSKETFARSPVVLEMLEKLWDSHLNTDVLDELKKPQLLADIIVQQCPTFYKMYDSKKKEYNTLVHALDTADLKSWAASSSSWECECGLDDQVNDMSM
jgi:hypothetical protein